MALSGCNRVLIANRGEIACRIALTLKQLGIYTIGVFSDADRFAPHCTLVDEALYLGHADSRDSYLSIEAIVAACKKSKADAVHPGYGFLSENSDFVKRLAKEKITFIGPSAEAMRMVGDKIEAKKLAESLSIPLVPGAECDADSAQSKKMLLKTLKEIGYPVVVKAAAGGGGRGMRVVRSEKEVDELIVSASREAKASFGDGRVFIEKYLAPARHIEIQFFGDSHGDAITLFERDCTLQRRHQKVVEEAPAINLPAKTKTGLHRAAKELAKASRYSGAGTAEFLVTEEGNYYFLEVNSRLQVEHPVTELITGLDLVALQVAVARGDSLKSLVQGKLPKEPLGHAIEVRLCAEVPEENFRASTGTVSFAHFPHQSWLRVDSWLGEHTRVSHYYDSLLAKIIVFGATRDEAVSRMQIALREAIVGGISTNQRYLSALVSSDEYSEMKHSLSTAQEIASSLGGCPLDSLVALLACIAATEGSNNSSLASLEKATWNLSFAIGKERWEVATQKKNNKYHTTLKNPDGSSHVGTLSFSAITENQWNIQWNGAPYSAGVLRRGSRFCCNVDGYTIDIERTIPSLKSNSESPEDAEHGAVTSPLPGKIVEVKVSNDASVHSGTALIILESMKMEHVVTAPRDGTISNVSVKAGDTVDAGKVLLEIR